MRQDRPTHLGRAIHAMAMLALLCGTAGAADEEANPNTQLTLEPIVVGQPQKIEVFPAAIRLVGPRQLQHVVVAGIYADGQVQDLTRVATLTSTRPEVVRVDQGIAYPVADGAAEVVVAVGGHEVKVPVEVSRFGEPDPISFNYGVLVALSKQGCNQGACHGSPSGKGGFRLSLRAYDPALDQLTLVREFFARRTNPLNPESSLLLQKPLMKVAHGGGRRMSETDPSYHILRNWIAEGCRLDPADAPKCVGLEVYPRQRLLHHPAHTQQLVVLARFSDGSTRDVTQLACYSSSDEAVATVTEGGLMVAQDRGESAVLVRYLEFMETVSLTYLKDVPGFQWNNPPANNYIDELVFKKLQQLQITPSDLCTDSEFIRRVYLDLLGILPEVSEVQAFLADSAPDKRAKLIDALLQRPEYAEFAALRWGDLLRIKSAKVTAPGVHKFRRWLVAAMRDNMPYDQFARELLAARGSTLDNPPANYYRTAADMTDCTETTSQLFLGIRIQCAKCHNHPFERWTQDNYYGIGAFFNRIQRTPTQVPDEMVIFVSHAGEVTQPRTGRQMKPWLPLSGEIDVPNHEDRRDHFVEWLVRKDNPFFAKVGVNRIWGHLIGRGIVDPIDDFRDSNPPSNAELLEALAADFAQNNFDMKAITRTILNSRTYQLSARTNDFNKNDEKYFSHARTRLLSAEQLLDAVCHVTGVPEKFAGLPAGTRATQLPSPDVDNYFLKVFGQPAREMACECERSNESNLSQALQMINGPLIHDKLRNEGNRLRKAVAAGKTDAQIIEELYLVALARTPTQPELDAAVAHVAGQEDRIKGLEDVCWAILNAKEFLFQH